MTAKFNRRVAVTAALATAGAWAATRVNQPALFRTNLGRIPVPSASRPPIFIAMLDRHAQRIAGLIPFIESVLNRRLEIDALSMDELYSWFTIDLLQQTGRYDVVSMSDEWIPYFGRRGYLANVPKLDVTGRSLYPAAAHSIATGVDGSELVAYPWTFDFTCNAWNERVSGQVGGQTWAAFFASIGQVGDIRLGIGLEPTRSAAQVFRSVLLSFGSDVVDESASEPVLDRYAAIRALETTLRLARIADISASMMTTQAQVIQNAISGSVDLAIAVQASDAFSLFATGDWHPNLIPGGRPGQARTSASFWMLGVPAGAPNRDEARAFVELMTGTDIQRRLWSEAQLLPVTRPALNAQWESGGAALQSLVFAALDHVKPHPVLRSYRSMIESVGGMVTRALELDAAPTGLLLETNEKLHDAMALEDELG